MHDNTALTIAIVSYNSHAIISTCLDELITSNEFPVIIVDNASPDGSGQKLKQRYPNVTVIQVEQNIGYGRAANRAIAAAETPYLFLINPDLKARCADVSALFGHMRKQSPDVALMAPAVQQKDFVKKGIVEKDWVIGAAMMFNLGALQKVGVFDENIFLFSEESDLCLRIRRAGMRILLDSDLYVEHLYRQSSTPSARIEYLKNWHFGWSRMYFYSKHDLATGKKSPYRVASRYLMKYLFATRADKRQAYRAKMLGTLAFIRGQSAFLPDGRPQCAP